jgi:RHS repeat-associated protein
MRKYVASAFCILFSALAFPSWGGVSSEELVAALGLSGDLTASSLILESGATSITPVDSAAVHVIPNSGQAVELSTGVAGQSQLGDKDFNDDDEPDCTSLSLTLNVPDGKTHLVYSTSFVTAESDTGSGDYAVLRYSLDGGPGAWEPLGDAYSAATTDGGGQVKTRSSLDLSGAGELALEFEVCDIENGDVDSALVILELAFSTGELVSAAELAEALVPEQYTVLSSRLAVSSNGEPVPGIEAARAVPAEGGVYLYTGIAEDSGIGSTDLLQDVYPDCVEFELELEVPYENPNTDVMSLLFTTQFSTAEPLGGSGANDYAQLEYTIHSGHPPTTMDLGSVALSAEPSSRPLLRALNVIDTRAVSLNFSICDAGNGSVDSALFISRLFFSDQIDATAVVNPRPDKSKPSTGTYSYSKQLLNVPGKSPFLPFDFSIHYSSTPVDYKVTLDCFYLFGLFPMACIPYYDYYRSWAHSYEWRIASGEGEIIVKRGDGVWEYFTPGAYDPATGTIVFHPKHGGNFSSLVLNFNSLAFTYMTSNQIRYTLGLSPWGHRLNRISDAKGNEVSIEHLSSTDMDITDTRGNVARLRWNGRGKATIDYAGLTIVSLDFAPDSENSYNLVAATDPLGQRTVYSYRNSTVEHNLLERITDPDGNDVVRLQYDGDSRVTRQWDANGSVTTNRYQGPFVYRTDREGSETLDIFDMDDRILVTQDALGGIVNFAYDENHNVIAHVDQLGFETRQTYDGPNLTERINATDDVTTATFDSRNNKLTKATSKGAESFASRFDYDEIDNLVTVTDPIGQKLHYDYNESGQVEYARDRNGNEFRYYYNNLGDLASVVDPTGATTTMEYDGLGRKVRSVGRAGGAMLWEYDLAGQMKSETDPLGRTTHYKYDGEGHVLEKRAPGGAVTTFAYRPTGEILRVTDPVGISLSYDYDREGRQTRSIDPLGRSVNYDYDAGGRLIRVNVMDESNRLVNSASATYDSVGNSVSVIDPRGNATRFGHDSLKRITTEINPLGNVTRNAYDDPRGLLTKFTNARGQSVEFYYDPSGRLTVLDFPGGTRVAHSLDGNGNQLQTIGRDGSIIQRDFDSMNRMEQRIDGFGNRISYVYDAESNLTSLTYSDSKTVHYTYDPLNRLESVTDWDGRVTRYAYNDIGKLAETRAPDGSRVSYSYDLSGRLTEIVDLAADGSVIYRSSMGYNDAGLRVSEEVEAPLVPRTGKLDRKLTYNAANQFTQEGRNSSRYDADGNMVEGTVGGTTRSFVYDETNQLVGAGRDSFQYDPDGMRVQTRIDNQVVRNVYDPSGPFPRLLEQHDAKGRIIARYVYGVGLIGREIGHTDRLQVYHFDSRGSTVAITDKSGRVKDAYAYNPYGEVAARQGSANSRGRAWGTPTNPFTFLGRWGVVDDGNGLYHMGARYYAPELMRFIQKDPEFGGKLSDPQSLNRYSYAVGNPIQLIDPTGTYFLIDDAIISLIGAVANMLSVLISDLISGEWSSYLDYMASFIGGIVWGETFLYTGNPFVAGTLSAVVEQGWLGFTYMMATPYQFALTMTTPDWEAFGIKAAVSIGIGSAMSAIPMPGGGGKFAGLKKVFGTKVWSTAVLMERRGLGSFVASRFVLKAGIGLGKGFFVRGDRWGAKDNIPLISSIPTLKESEQVRWDPLSP